MECFPGLDKYVLRGARRRQVHQHAGRRVYFTARSLLVQELLRAKQEPRLGKQIKRLAKFDGIIIDDIGYAQHGGEEMEVFFTLLAERYERGSILLTSNLPFSKWERIFKDPITTAAAWSTTASSSNSTSTARY